MASKYFVTLLLTLTIIASAASSPLFFGKKHNEHYIIHVPYKVHTVHHHHVEKVPIYKEIPVIKHVPVYKEIHHAPLHLEQSHGWSDGWSNGWY